MFRPGDTLNHGAYRIERELGAGGFGVVYLAEELRLRRKVAIKTLLPDLVAREPEMAEAFYAEARLTAGLAHPNILPIHFVGEEERGDQRLPYIVMEYIEGGDLEAVLAQGRGDLPQRLRWMRQITDGLAYAHAQGVVHRDLKPRNIFLTRTNTAKIGDFGLAKALGAETQTVLKGLGTAAYIAPEQIQGRPADARADLYALGVMYYQILTGRLPYDAPGVSDTVAKIMAICYQHINAPVPAARAVNPDIPAELDALTQRLMAKTPEGRPASAAEVIPILEACLRPAGPPPPVTQTVEGLTPREPGPPPPEPSSSRPVPPPHPPPAQPESPLAPTQAVVAPPQRVRWTWLAIPAAGLVLLVGAVVFWATRGGDGPPPPPAPRAQATQPTQPPAPAPEAGPQEAARRQAEDERKKLQAEVEAARKQVEELRLAKLRDEQQRQAEAKQAAEARKANEAQEAKARAEDAARKQAGDARQKAEAAKQAEAERLRRNEEARAAQLQEQRRQEEARKANEAQEAKARAEDAARKQAAEARQKAEAPRASEPAELQRQVIQRLADNGLSSLTATVTPDRSVRLTGVVDSTQKRDQALKLASATPGITQVHDRIGVNAGCREPAPAPRYVTGETWTWRYDKGGEWADRVIADGELAKIKTANGDVLVYDKDRILKLVVRSTGEILTQPDYTAYVWLGKKTLDFPLQVGRNWQYPFFQATRNYINKYSVVTCEAVSTPAAKLEAFKIEVEESYIGSTNKGVLHLWYAPQVKNYIKRQYVPSQWWSADRHRDFALVKYVAE
jgi:serine/threonine protein kinase